MPKSKPVNIAEKQTFSFLWETLAQRPNTQVHEGLLQYWGHCTIIWECFTNFPHKALIKEKPKEACHVVS